MSGRVPVQVEMERTADRDGGLRFLIGAGPGNRVVLTVEQLDAAMEQLHRLTAGSMHAGVGAGLQGIGRLSMEPLHPLPEIELPDPIPSNATCSRCRWHNAGGMVCHVDPPTVIDRDPGGVRPTTMSSDPACSKWERRES